MEGVILGWSEKALLEEMKFEQTTEGSEEAKQDDVRQRACQSEGIASAKTMVGLCQACFRNSKACLWLA